MDLIDKKILCELDLNCRTPISKIAKKLRIARNVVDYRVRRMEEERIITGYICTVNLGLLGYKTFKVFYKVNQIEEQLFVKHLVESPKVINLLKTEGYYDYASAIAVKKVEELDDFLMDLGSKFKCIRDYDISILLYTKIYKMNKMMLQEKEYVIKDRRYSGEATETSLNEKDISILKAISKNANISITEIARKTSLGLDVIKYRLKQLNNKVISSNRVMIDFTKMGYHHYVIMLRMKQYTKHDQEKLDYWCSVRPNVLYYGKRIGHFDFEINVAIKDLEELNQLLNDLKTEFFQVTDHYELVLNRKLLKLNYLPF